jgi:hypothetical protein
MFYCSVTQIKNWFLREPLLDYLNFYGDKEKQVKPYFEECDFSTFIMDMGNKWEEIVVNMLIEKCKKEGIIYTSVERKSGYHQTKTALQQGIDVIFQAQVKDWTNNIVGYPDIIVKKKAFLKLFKSRVNELNSIKDNDYIVMDIKYSTIQGSGPTSEEPDNYIVENSNYIRFIRGQISMYSRLGKFNSKVGFIISKDPSSIEYPIATINNDPEIVKDCDDAIKWLKMLYEKGKDLDISSILPNMKNTMDGYWRDYKKELLGITPPNRLQTIIKKDALYITTVMSNKFEFGETVREYLVAVMVKNKDETYFNISNGLTEEDENRLLDSLDLFLKPLIGTKKIVSYGVSFYGSVRIDITPERKGKIRNKMEICAAYNRNKVSSEIIKAISQYCLEDCNELENEYSLL